MWKMLLSDVSDMIKMFNNIEVGCTKQKTFCRVTLKEP